MTARTISSLARAGQQHEMFFTVETQGAEVDMSRPGAPRKKRALPPAILFDAFGVYTKSLRLEKNFTVSTAEPQR